MKDALFYNKLDNNKVQCTLCPHKCVINDKDTGNCKVRTNVNGNLFSDNYGKISGYHLDPIEKKPLYHYYPGKSILSIGSVGCNLHCKFCQNHEIAQTGIKGLRLKELSPDSIVNDALRQQNNIGIAYTYNEPLVYYEFMRDTALLAKQYKLKNVMVTNGYFTPEPLQKMFNFIDAFSIDLKSFSEQFYRKITSSGLKPVKDSLVEIRKSGLFFEITNLIIPGLNDNEREFKEMLVWIATELGEETVLHLSRYFPHYKLKEQATSEKEMMKFYTIATKYLKFVYLGNMASEKGQNTYCPNCGHLLINRNGYFVQTSDISDSGRCLNCKQKILEHC